MSNVIPLDAKRRIAASLQPASLREIQAAVAMLGKALPIMPSIQDPAAYKAIMVEFLAPYSADALMQAVHQAIIDYKQMPTISQMLALCRRFEWPRREELRRLEQAEADKEYQQRKAAARAAEAARAARRAAEEVARRQTLQSIEKRSRERFGGAAPLPGDVALADSTGQKPSRGPWLAALDRGEEWAAKFCRLAALAQRLRNAMSAGRCGWDVGLALAKKLDIDEAGIRESIGAIEQRPVGSCQAPTESFWRQIWRVHRACGCDVPRGIFPEEDIAAALSELSGLSALAADREILERQAKGPKALYSRSES